MGDASGDIIPDQVFCYDAFGNALGFDPSTAATALLFNGEHFEALTGLQYLRARCYDPNTGRFTSLDPYSGNLDDPLSLHKYLFCHHDAINYSDPNGMYFSLLLGVGMGAGLGSLNAWAHGGNATEKVVSGIVGGLLGAVTAGLGPGVAAWARQALTCATRSVIAGVFGIYDVAQTGVSLYTDYMEGNVAGGIFDAVTGFFSLGLTRLIPKCFVAGTQVLTELSLDSPEAKADYRTRNIEDIQVGDGVVAWDAHTGATALKIVDEIYRRTADELCVLEIASEDGRCQTLRTTPEHPFWVIGRGWIVAGQLQPNMQLLGPAGERTRLAKASLESHPEGVPVFNLRVTDYHNYFVAESLGGVPVLVHNANYAAGWTESKWFKWISEYTTAIEAKPKGTSPAQIDAFDFQVKHCGPMEYKVRAGGVTYQADGIAGKSLIDAKHARGIGSAPYRNEVFPPVQSQMNDRVLDELTRARKIIQDPSSPFDELVMVINDRRTEPYFRTIAEQAGMPKSMLRFVVDK